MSRLLLGVSGGIAAYKALEIVRLATASGHAVRVIQTPASRRFVGGASFAAITGAPVLSDGFEDDPARGAFPGQAPPTHQPLSHLQLAANADAYLIAPASANTLARLAHGLADNLVCSVALAAAGPVVVAPAMNDRMYDHPATRHNLDVLRRRGVRVVEPDVGRLGSPGEWGVGRLAQPARILEVCEAAMAASIAERSPEASWAGVRVLISAGGTREPIDSVRFVGNRSSGRMGYALAERALARGADVTVVSANVALARDIRARHVDVCTAAELEDACGKRFPTCDVLLMAGAVADFRPVSPLADKLKKGQRRELALTLEPTPDILSGLSSRRRPGQTLVGFAAEHGPDAMGNGRDKLAAKGVDAIVVNDISRSDVGFEGDANEVTILTADTERHVARASKTEVAGAILDVVESLRGAADTGA